MLLQLFPSRTIAWYTARLFLVRTFAILIGLVVVLETLDLLGESSRILAAGNTEAALWHYVALRVPQVIALFLPFSVLLATLFTLATLNANSEVVIFKSAGISAHQILAPLVVAAFGIATLNFAINERIGVRANKALTAWQTAGYKPVAATGTKLTEGWARSGNDLFHAEIVTGSGAATRLSDVTIYERRNNKLLRVVRAANATPVDGGWQLNAARVFDVVRGTEAAAAPLVFHSHIVPAQFTTVAVNPKFVPFWRLLPMIGQQREAGKPVAALIAAANHKIAGPLSAMLMPLLGSVAALGLARSGRLFVRIVAGMLLGFAFFVADNFMVAMGDFGTVPPALAAWSAFGLFFLIGEAVLFRTEE